MSTEKKEQDEAGEPAATPAKTASSEGASTASRTAKPAIKLEGLHKHFGEVRAVDGVSFEVPQGSVFGLIGPNGAGKTTTFSMLAGYLVPTEGTVRVLGEDPRTVSALKGRVGILPQDAMLPPSDRVGELLVHFGRLQGLGPLTAKESAKEALARVEGSDWWPLECGGLSHGMAKRVGIAQALLGKPELILLDEPTAGLDPKVAFHVRKLVKELGGERTVVVSSHNLAELEAVCTGAAILDHGKLVASGTMEELTRASAELQVQLRAGTTVPLVPVKALPVVQDARFDAERSTLVVKFDPKAHEAEEVIAEVLGVLLAHKAKISGLSKGRGLEQRVLELT